MAEEEEEVRVVSPQHMDDDDTASESVPTTEIDGDVSITRSIAAGGDVAVRGSVKVGHNLKVDGWLEAENIIGPYKGVFKSAELLQKSYPSPRDGWWAFVSVSESTSAGMLGQLYVADGGVWVAQVDGKGNPLLAGIPKGDSSEHAVRADYATKADEVEKAVEAEHALKADAAESATEAEHAVNADMALKAKDLTDDSPVYKRFLSKVSDDVAAGRITFMQGLLSVAAASLEGGATFGEYEQGAAWTTGKGAAIDKDGNAEVESLRVRSYMECVELIVNRLSALEGDQLLTEADTIETAEELSDGVWGLTLREKWDGYHTAQAVGNVVKGIINTLAEAAVEADDGVETASHEDSGDTSQTAGDNEISTVRYYTSWMRVDEVDAAKNYIKVSLYSGEDVPGGRNYPPCSMMKIARWGNQTDETRQSCLYLSSTEGRIVKLTGVTKPILEVGNYGVTLGSLPDFVKKLTDDNGNALPLREGLDYLYAPGIVTMDVIRLNKWTRKPVVTYVDRGVWQEGETYYCETLNESTGEYETSEVWHKGCKYRCMKTGTVAEPSRTGTDWAYMGGYPELSSIYEMKVDTGGDNMIGDGEEKVLTCTVFDGFHDDVTADVRAWTVTRDSGDEEADKAWGYDHADFTGTLTITLEDLRDKDKVTFTVTAYMTDEEIVEARVSVK